VNAILRAAFVLAIVAAAACGPAQASPAPNAASTAAALRTTPAVRGSIAQSVRLSGSVRSQAQYRLGFRQPGRLAERLVAAGDRVQTGQILARLETADLEAAAVAAQARYDQVVAGASAEDLAAARLAVDSAGRTLDSTQRSTSADLSAAKDSLEQLVASYGAAKTSLATLTNGIASEAGSMKSGIDASRTLAKRAMSEISASAGQTAEIVAARNALGGVDGSLRTAQDLVALTTAPYDDYVAKRDVLLVAVSVVETTATPTAKQNFQIALAAFNDSTTRYSTSLDAVFAQLAAASTAVAPVDTTLNGAASRIFTDLDPARADVARLQVQITATQQSGASVKARLGQIASAITTVTAYVSGGLSAVQQGVTSAQERSNAALVASQNALDSARLALQRTAAPPKAYDVAAAYAALLAAQTALDGATLRAPAAGTVLSISAELGETVSGAFVVLNAATLQLYGTVGESEVAKLNVGQTANVRVEAIGGAMMSGSVGSIDAGATQGSIPLYGVAITIATPDPAVRTGMSGSADIIITSRDNVIVIPSQVVRVQGTRVFVQVVKDGQVTDREVKLGAANDAMTEITSGLSEGEMVAYPRDRTR
jgi:multidrug efflux pump subunit AcrA (membrane-fusion protein)